MKNLAKLILFFSFSFIVVFIVSMLLGLLSSWVDLVRIIPAAPGPGEDAAGFVWKALPAALYLSILLALSYTARRNLSIFLTIVSIFILGCVFSAGVSLGISRTGLLRPTLSFSSPIRGAPGLILSRSDNAMILLKESGDIRGPRVVSIPGRPLIYQETPVGPNNTILTLPALPFADERPWFIRSLDIDFSLCAGELRSRLGESFFSFAAYAFSLVLLLGSLRFIFELSRWPLANILLGALVFRLILLLETFINTREINTLLGSFLKEQLPSGLITPLVFTAMAFLIILYTLLSRIANPRKSSEAAEPGREGDD